LLIVLPLAKIELPAKGVPELFLLALPAGFNGDIKVKDAIVTVLGFRWPLSLKAVYFAVVRDYSMRVSCQAVHKALKELVERGVVVKEKKEYCLSIDWIRKVKQFGLDLEQAYTQECSEFSNNPQAITATFNPAKIKAVTAS